MQKPLIAALALSALLAACGNPLPGEGSPPGAANVPGDRATHAKREKGEVVTPPFAVSGELEGLLLVWFDAEGPHSASRLSEIPQAHRKEVRVDSLRIAPEKRLDAEYVYLADVSKPDDRGAYPVRKYSRAFFDARVEAARGGAQSEQASASTGVTIYMASWCGACRSAASFLRSRGVAFVEKDIEKDAAANAEMLRKAQAAGKRPSGVPVIDFRGQILLGFDRASLERLIGQPI